MEDLSFNNKIYPLIPYYYINKYIHFGLFTFLCLGENTNKVVPLSVVAEGDPINANVLNGL